MQTRKIATIVMVIAVLALLSAASSTVAGLSDQWRKGSEGVALAGSVASKISYQGRLTDAGGNPLNGTYNLVFQLWDDATAGSQVGSDIAKNGVAVNDGLFTVELDVPQFAFDGQALWLQISVNGQVLSPRQELLPAPYALGLKPGAHVDSDDSSAIAFWGSASSYLGVGVYGTSSGITGRGVFGEASGYEGMGVNGRASGGYGVGVRGESDYIGVHGWTSGPSGKGVYGEGGHTGVHGWGTSDGVKGESTDGTGVKGRSDNNDGVVGWTGASGKSGVFGRSQVGIGVTGRSDGDAGVVAVTTSSNSDHVALVARNEGSGPAIYAESGTDGLAAIFNGRISTHVLEITGGSDLSEQFEIRGIRADSVPSPGMVVSIAPEHPGDLMISNQAYDRRVAGIISGAGGIQPGMLMGQSGTLAAGEYPVALTGRVYCWADASNDPIAPGDLLTTSDTPGHAMKVTDNAKAQGAILGKAMSSLDEGKGLVLVLVSLQ